MKKKVPPDLNFHERLAAFRKERGLTQQALAELVQMHISPVGGLELQAEVVGGAAQGAPDE